MKDKIKKFYLYSSISLFLSLIAFSVAIPYGQSKIDSIKEDRELYVKNLVNSITYGSTKTICIDIYNALTFLLIDEETVKNEKIKEAIKKIRKMYYQRAQEAYGGQVFLETEPPSDTPPNEERLKELQRESIEELDNIRLKNDFSTYNKEHLSNLRKWNQFKTAFLMLAIFFQLLGLWFSLKSKEKSEENEITDEMRRLLPRINILIKKLNKDT
jgi:hypothetical protein